MDTTTGSGGQEHVIVEVARRPRWRVAAALAAVGVALVAVDLAGVPGRSLLTLGVVLVCAAVVTAYLSSAPATPVLRADDSGLRLWDGEVLAWESVGAVVLTSRDETEVEDQEPARAERLLLVAQAHADEVPMLAGGLATADPVALAVDEQVLAWTRLPDTLTGLGADHLRQGLAAADRELPVIDLRPRH